MLGSCRARGLLEGVIFLTREKKVTLCTLPEVLQVEKKLWHYSFKNAFTNTGKNPEQLDV